VKVDEGIGHGTCCVQVLVRDIVASVVIAIGITFIIAAIGRRLAVKGSGPAIRVITCLVVTLLFGVIAPVGVVMVHCTSGDCL
jgi:hypothetical protein